MIEIRRYPDGELCGYVDPSGEKWSALAVFGGLLGTFDSREAAEHHVLESGLTSLADRWWYRPDARAEWQVVCIVEAWPGKVRLALGYYSTLDVPTTIVTSQQIGDSVGLTLHQP